MSVNPSDVRRIAIVAMFSDDSLMGRLVLKGGNALDLVHGLSARGSLDIDFSIEDDFGDLEDTKRRIFEALSNRFDSAGLFVFDQTFVKKPSELRQNQDKRWGGYLIEFKVIPKEMVAKLDGSLERMRMNAAVTGSAAQERRFRIEISKFEFCSPKVETEFDDYTIYVYTPEMIAAEKLRAICQQMPSYSLVRNKRARARDFYDFHSIITRVPVDVGTRDFHDLVRAIFSAKDVSLKLLAEIAGQREFHRPDWPSVVLSLTETAREFDFYFDFVLSEAAKLETLWEK